MDVNEFEQLLRLGHETHGVEFKGPGSSSDSKYFSKVVRAILGMSNRRDGGYVIIGVEDDMTPTGLTKDLRKSWSYDDVSDRVAKYADPYVNFELEELEYRAKQFIVIIVKEFEEVPVICKKDYSPNLQRGATYVRGRGKPKTAHIPSQTEMRELLDVAVSKKIQQYIRVLRVSDVEMNGKAASVSYDEINSKVETTDVMEKIQSRGWWTLTVAPESLPVELVPDIVDLETLVRTSSVDTRGWRIPYVNDRHLKRKVSWIESEVDFWTHVERLIFHQNGLLMFHRAYITDWVDQAETGAKPDWKPNEYFPVMDTIGTLTGMFEFVSRLVTSDAYRNCAGVRVEVTAHNLTGRTLITEDPRRVLFDNYTSDVDNYPWSDVFKRDQLIGNQRDLALNLADQIFKRFGLTLERHVLEEIQSMK